MADQHREQVWQTRVRGVTWTCELTFQGESWGWMAMVYRNGAKFGGHRHLLKADAMKWAVSMKSTLPTQGPE